MVNLGPLKRSQPLFRVDHLDKESLVEALEAAEPGCKCDVPENKYVLDIECGNIEVLHATCGKPPWWMLDDFIESVSLGPLVVEASITGTEPDYYGEIDGPQIDLNLIKEVSSGSDDVSNTSQRDGGLSPSR
jgi:hypothetical protein